MYLMWFRQNNWNYQYAVCYCGYFQLKSDTCSRNNLMIIIAAKTYVFLFKKRFFLTSRIFILFNASVSIIYTRFHSLHESHNNATIRQIQKRVIIFLHGFYIETAIDVFLRMSEQKCNVVLLNVDNYYYYFTYTRTKNTLFWGQPRC